MSKLTRQQLPAEDLGDITKPKSRASGLADLIGPVPAAPLAPVPDRPQRREVPEVDPQPAEPAPAAVAPVRLTPPDPTTRKPGRPRTRNKPASAVYVTAGVKKRFEKYRHDNKSTNLQVVLQAISAMHKAEKLDQIIQESRYSTAPVNELFPADPSAVRYLGGGSSQISFSPTPEQEAVIDQIGKKLGFDTRSTWIAPVLNAFLPGKKDATAQ
ncbi:hypothetical protein JF781_21195 [Mycobacterium sp. WUMAC-067]|uniref:hypothetical protein n=1 Tax=unclassified Mycobacterium TaxID=2642494 RepID=UPI001CDA10E4|nr:MULTISPECIES: hypothetical protein [unclassified Mycobacterium]MCA2244875.1 hypothetical protein [Mycobacterium sp. WUMAC-067]MCA2316268.1 hypothetical protein [Mycobacterium sp. WUMAC-025]